MTAIVSEARARANGTDTRPEDNPESIHYQPGGAPTPKPELVPQSATRIELFIRPAFGDSFGTPFCHHHDAVGIKNPRIGPGRWLSAYGVCDPDTEALIAHFEPNEGWNWRGLTQVRVTIDPETCAISWGAARQFTSTLTSFAKAMGGTVLDGLGAPVSDDAMKGLEDHIRATVHRRMEETEQARTVQVDRYTTRTSGALSYQFRLTTRKPGSRYPNWTHVYFDAPSLPYYAGTAAGFRMAREMVEYLRQHKTSDAGLENTILEAARMAANMPHPGMDGCHSEHVAHAFMRCITTLVKVGAQNLNMKWLDHHIAEYDAYEAKYGPARDAKKAAVSRRLNAARAAKRAQRKGGAA